MSNWASTSIRATTEPTVVSISGFNLQSPDPQLGSRPVPHSRRSDSFSPGKSSLEVLEVLWPRRSAFPLHFLGSLLHQQLPGCCSENQIFMHIAKLSLLAMAWVAGPPAIFCPRGLRECWITRARPLLLWSSAPPLTSTWLPEAQCLSSHNAPHCSLSI